MFQNRQWPEGFVFPACTACNSGSAESDFFFGLAARWDPFSDAGDADGQGSRQAHALVKKYPEFAKEMLPTAIEARKLNRAHGIRPEPGQLQQETGVVKMPTRLIDAIYEVSLKLTKAIYYRERHSVFPATGGVAGVYFTNSELISNGSYSLVNFLAKLGGVSRPTVRQGKSLDDYFQWKITDFSDGNHFLVQAIFGRAFGVATISSPKQGELESTIASMRKRTGKSGPFKLLQGDAV